MNKENVPSYLNVLSIIKSLLNESLINEIEFYELENHFAKKYNLPDKSIYRCFNLHSGGNES